MMPTFTKRFDPYFEFRPREALTEDQARMRMASGKMLNLLFGNPRAPELYIAVFDHMNRIDVIWPDGEESIEGYYIINAGNLEKDYGTKGLFLNEYKLKAPRHGHHAFDIFFADAFVNGCFPRYSRRTPPLSIHAIAATFEPAYLGDPPSFDELCDGSFLARLPRIAPPDPDLLAPFIPQDQRKPNTPKRSPKGRYPPDDEKRLPQGLASLTGHQLAATN